MTDPTLRAPEIEKNQSRLKFSISLEIFNPDLENSPRKIGVWWVARLKFSISLENFKILNFFNLWALREGDGAQSAVSCENFLRIPVVSCALQMLEFSGHGVFPAKVFAIFCENLRFPAVSCALQMLEFPPCPSFPCFFGIPCFFSLQGIPCFFERFSLLFQGF